jgi:hypothetical protein
MVLKTIFILATAFGSCAAIISDRLSAWEMLGLAMLLGLLSAGAHRRGGRLPAVRP